MKELHNHIFSNTTCISKEIMLKYINNQLSVKELHEVEKHLIDCEFCSEALEGLKYAENSSILFAIDNQIDQRVRMGGAKSTVMRNLMVAASILLVATVSWFTFDYFESAVDQQNNLALKEDASENTEDDLTKEMNSADQFEGTGAATTSSNLGNNTAGPVATEQLQDRNQIVEEKVLVMPEAIQDSPMEDVEVTINDELDMVMEAEADEEAAYNYYREPAVEANKPKAIINESVNQAESTTESNAGGAVAKDVLTKTAERKSNDNRSGTKTDKQKSKGNKKRAMSPSYKSESRAEEQEMLMDDDALTTITLSSFKVVDYTAEYQEAYDLKNSVETSSVPAGFANEEDKMAAEKEKEELEVEVTYRATLEKGMAYFKAEKYVLALEQFDIILKKHPDEVNGLFYGGLSYYNLDRYGESLGKLEEVLKNERSEFNEEATWYKALTLIQLNRKDEAKSLLKQIEAKNGFYSSKAQAKLKEL